MREVTIPVTFKVGTIDEIGLGGFHQSWIDGAAGGVKYSLTSGAGLGSALLQGSAQEGDRYVFAQADIRPLAAELFDQLTAELRRSQDDEYEPDPIDLQDEARGDFTPGSDR